MRTTVAGRCVRVYIGESDQYHGKSLYVAIVQAARKSGLAGATVARGIMGYGGHSVVHKQQLFALSYDLPVVIEIIDTDDRIQAFLPILDGMIQEGMITTSEVEVVRYKPGT